MVTQLEISLRIADRFLRTPQLPSSNNPTVLSGKAASQMALSHYAEAAGDLNEALSLVSDYAHPDRPHLTIRVIIIGPCSRRRTRKYGSAHCSDWKGTRSSRTPHVSLPSHCFEPVSLITFFCKFFQSTRVCSPSTPSLARLGLKIRRIRPRCVKVLRLREVIGTQRRLKAYRSQQ